MRESTCVALAAASTVIDNLFGLGASDSEPNDNFPIRSRGKQRESSRLASATTRQTLVDLEATWEMNFKTHFFR